MRKTTALIVGGSGMLAEFCREIAGGYAHIGVIGRTKSKMQNVNAIPNLVPIYTDYNNLEALKRELADFVGTYGKPNLTVAWVHTSAQGAVQLIAQFCEDKFYEVAGSSGAQKSHISHKHEGSIKSLGLEYHRIVLGSINNRWLTDPEISQGVLAALSDKSTQHIIGEI